MVLKVVTGKILKTCRLMLPITGRVPFWYSAKVALEDWWSGIIDYLIDNMYNDMLSQLRGKVKQKTARLLVQFRNGTGPAE